MKRGFKQPIPRGERGAAMLAALCLAMVFALSLSSYIALCYTSLSMSTRAIEVAHSTELAETGAEQALYALNNNDWTGWSISGSTATETMTMTSGGLALSSTSPTSLNYGNNVTEQVVITVNNYNLSSGAPSVSSVATFTMPKYGGISGSSIPITGTIMLSPLTGATSALGPVFVNAVAATATATSPTAANSSARFKTTGLVDSYNSNPSTGTLSPYLSTSAGYSAVVLSLLNNSAISGATVRLGNTVVHGYAAGYDAYYASSDPTSTNWLSYSSNGALLGPNTASGTTIDSSRILTLPNPYQPVVSENNPSNFNYSTIPSASSSDGYTLNQTCTLGSTTATAPVYYDYSGGISLTASQIVTIQGPVVIVCYSDITFSQAARIQLTTPQASLQIFLEYGNLSLGGTSIVNMNATPLPKKVSILDTTNNWASATITTTQPYYGVMYLPYMPITFTSLAPTIYGSIVGQSVIFDYYTSFHYDRALRSPLSVTTPFSSTALAQYGAAFDNLSAPFTFGGLTASVQ
jgi:hypothetical protein